MLEDDVARQGWHIDARERAARFQVLGERCSGTNFVKRLIGRNSALTATEEMGWKHGFPSMIAIPEDLAVVCVVRDARDWALSVHARPWHCPPEMQRLAFRDFIRAEWTTVADRARYFPQVAREGGLGRPLQPDRDPMTGAAFPDLFALRRTKLAALLSYKRRGCTLVLARFEAVRDAPQEFLATLHDVLDLGLPPVYRPVVKRLGNRFKPAVEPRPSPPTRFPDTDLALLRARLDLRQEAALGYSYD
ncbi:hypothetical protein [Citreimonas salinaria]|uniref:Sulfotransferase family protein n=1 Tax=Citreimonas salinaria TaxID=321339 RepID=A0A1H3INX5_9RHOB|nr:hypothetical protein [Citreimonas salinaria]SDY28979.1 hypothetical protein SAMN05444340_105162 [Citreimonas salinaria]